MNQENCVSHLPSLIPVPGRNIMTQAWYQGGLSVIDFTDSAHPKEIAYYDRGPISSAPRLVLGGLWSTYYYNGAIYGSEIARGFDAWKLTPTAELSANEIKAASEVEIDPADAAAPAAVHLGAELRRRALAPRPARAGRTRSTTQTLQQAEKFISAAEDYAARDKPVPAAAEPAGAVEAPQGRPVRRAPAGCPRPRGDLRLVGAESD